MIPMHHFYILLWLQIILMLIAFIITHYRFIKSKFLSILLLSLLFFLLAIWSIFTLVGSMSKDAIMADICLRTGVLFGTAGFILIVLFISSLFSSRANYYVFFVATAVYGMFFASVAYYKGAMGIWIADLNGYLLVFIDPIARFTFFVLALITVAYSLWVTIAYVAKPLRYQKNISWVSKVQITLFLLAEIIAIGGSAAGSYLTKGLPFSERLTPFLLVVNIGTILILVGYLLSPRIPYLITAQPLYLYVVSEDGITIFSYNFLKQEILDAKGTLVGEIVHAIIQFGRQTLGLYTQLSTISWGDYILTTEVSESFTVLLVSRRYHHYLKSSIRLFAKYFNEKFGEELKKQTRFKKLNLFDACDILEKAFPFLTIKKKNSSKGI